MAQDTETLILVHGLWMHGAVFLLQRRRLARRGFAVQTFSYPSVRGTLDANARALGSFVTRLQAEKIHFVGHSLGGLIVLSMLARREDPRVGRVVLMGSPYRGSYCANVLARIPIVSGVIGGSIREWIAATPPPLPSGVGIGVISGDRSIGLGRLFLHLPKPNDGLVAVAETRLPHVEDAITLHVSHAEMLISAHCIDQAAAFLKTGRFVHGAA